MCDKYCKDSKDQRQLFVLCSLRYIQASDNENDRLLSYKAFAAAMLSVSHAPCMKRKWLILFQNIGTMVSVKVGGGGFEKLS